MKSLNRNVLVPGLAALALALALPAGAQPAINKIDAKAALKKAADAALVSFKNQFPTLKLVNPCSTEYNTAVAAAQTEHTACLDSNNPPAGSPFAEFNALSNTQLAAKCANKTLEECAASVTLQQSIFCAKERAISIAKAKSVLQRCCSPLSQRKADIQKELADITADLQSCLAK